MVPGHEQDRAQEGERLGGSADSGVKEPGTSAGRPDKGQAEGRSSGDGGRREGV